MIRKILLLLFLLLVVIQIFRPEKNIATATLPEAIEKHYLVPQEIQGILRTSCYDCHSNNTEYPWYSELQPLAWLQQNHINEGKREINFDEFNTNSAKKKKHKLDEVVEMIENNEMPLRSYTLMHKNAILSSQQKNMIIAWATKLQKSIQ